jgi:succinate dehydrogenase/fumarate reductase flavoprotein subunit
MLQVPVMSPAAYAYSMFWAGNPQPHLRMWGGGGLVVDWDLSTNLPGLFAAGTAVFGAGAHSSAAASGRYAGRKAATFSRAAEAPGSIREQIDREKARVYAPLQSVSEAIGWKEFNLGLCKVMQDYCGQYRSKATLLAGLRILQELRESEAKAMFAANPHELARTVECHSMITVGEMTMRASLARESSSAFLHFNRLDYPEVDPPEWRKLLTFQLDNDEVAVKELSPDYHLLPPYESTYEDNYRTHCDA